jgi:aminoglycoside phosphotransferase family enzyme/predicted kinase
MMPNAPQAPLIASLMHPEAFDHPVDGIRLLETHISWILLTGTYAYKIKKPVNLGFVDFSTPERRRWFCEEELRLNRRMAPELYLGLRPIHGLPASASFKDGGPVIEWAVQMRQFPQKALLAEALAAGAVDARHWRALADALAAFQASAAVAGEHDGGTADFGTAELVGREAQANLAALARWPDQAAHLQPLQHWTDTAFAKLAPAFEQRRRQGRVREGHGDLHLGNMVFLDDRIVTFDCLEFSPELRWIDVVNELAFLFMDLAEHGRAVDGARLLDRWLDRTGDYAGLALWRWYVVYRALVRAKVTALRLDQSGLSTDESSKARAAVSQYLAFAHASAVSPPGRLIITHGVSGSGKSHLSRTLCDQLGWIHLRSDAERKRLFGLWGTGADGAPSADAGLYQPAVTERLYGEVLPRFAAAVVQAGFSVVVDATFLQRAHRQTMAETAARCGARFGILDCRTSGDRARARIAQRQRLGGDPSDADATVLEHQCLSAEPLSPEEQAASLVVESGADIDAIARWCG